LRFSGLNQAGGTHAHIRRTIKRFGMDTSHLVRHQGGFAGHRLTAADLLVRPPRGSKRTKPPLLRRALDEIGRAYECVGCGDRGEWQGATLRLESDHVDGDHPNNLASNLRYLCPNCHSQTDNFSGRSRGKYTELMPLAIPTPTPGGALLD
jgi:hypothetical protein